MFVLDCSALAKSFLEEPRSDEFRDWFETAVARNEKLHAPALAASEVARVIQKEMDLTVDEQKELWQAVLLGVGIAPFDGEHVGVWDAAQDLGYYDAEYVDLALQLQAQLVTADRRQAKAAKAMGVDVLDFIP